MIEYVMYPLYFLHLAICVAYFNYRWKHLSLWNEISKYSRTSSECQNQGSLKKFLPDGNISTRKESFQLRHVKVVSNCHSINVNKQVDGQFSRKCPVPGSEGSPAAH